jgi:rhodanese-related sulfurtransferase
MPKINAISTEERAWGAGVAKAAVIAAGVAVLLWMNVFHGTAAGQIALSPAQARDLIEENRGNDKFVIIDLRTRNEFDEGHIEGARLIPYYAVNFNRMVSQLDRDATILLSCQKGRQSPLALRALQKLKFTDVRFIEGGIEAWVEAGLPLVP